jgi:DNA-binding response OmpR family regulator
MRILLVEDDIVISKNIGLFFRKKGIAVDASASIGGAFKKIIDEEYDCIVLDRGLPDGDGLVLIDKIREEDISVPVLVLTAKSENLEVLGGLNSGADDYVSKPFDMNILLARIKALIRRGKTMPQKAIIKVKDLLIDTNSMEVVRHDKKILLSPREFALLEYLAIHPNTAIDRSTLLSHVWDENTDMFSNTVDVHIKYLRNKVDNGFDQKLIKTVRGKGYMLCID